MATNDDLCRFARGYVGAPVWPSFTGGVTSPIMLQQLVQQSVAQLGAAENGRRVFGDAGLINGFIGTSYSSDEIYGASNVKGAMAAFPDLPGVLVLADGHVGIYIGNGKVVEAGKGAIVETKLAAGRWQRWCYCPFVAYPADTKAPAAKKRRRKKV